MKALFNYELYRVLDTKGNDDLELEHLESDAIISVSLADDRLIIDPTDGDLDEAEAVRALKSCDICPHENYLTISVREHRHSCASCGEVFEDRHRTKRYFGREAESR